MFLTLDDFEKDADYSNIQTENSPTRFADFVDKYEEELLRKILGHVLYEEFVSAYSEAYPDYLDQLEDKWDRILNGSSYVISDVSYKGVGIKEILKPYVYSLWNRLTSLSRAGSGLVESNNENSTRVSPTVDVVTSYNRAVNAIGGYYNVCNTFCGMMSAYRTDYPTWRFTKVERMNRFNL